jgi:Cyanate permease
MGSKNTGKRMLLTGAILQLFLGIIYVWSVFVMPVSEHFAWDVSKVKLTSSFMLCCFVLGILIGGKLQVKIGTSKIVLVGGLCMAGGMLLTSFIPASAPWLIYITYGITGGFGVGMAYNAIISCAQSWFVHNRGLATGISVCTFGFSTVIFAPVIEILVSNLGLLATFRVLAAAFLVATLALFSFITMPENAGAKKSAPVLETKQYTTGEMIKTPMFFMIMFSMMFLTSSYFILNPSFKTFALERGMDSNIGTVLVMLTGVANALGRLGIPLLGDKIGRERAVITIILATAVSTAALCFAKGALFMIAVAVIAFCYGGSSGIYPIVTADYFGIKNIGSNYGAIMVGFACSALIFPMIIGLITDTTVKFIVLAVLVTMGSVLIALLSTMKKKAQK